MLSLSDWTDERETTVNSHTLQLLNVSEDKVDAGCQYAATVLPKHYLSEAGFNQAFKALGKNGVAALLEQTLPRLKTTRSGELGEVFATEYIDERTDFTVPIRRLRWKDTRDMPMRGDDVIAIEIANNGTSLRYLKTEAKSRERLDGRTVREARQALDDENGLPSSHALAFIAQRLWELGYSVLSDALMEAQLTTNIRHNQVEHLLFVFTGNAPDTFLIESLENYSGLISQRAVGLQVPTHQDFIDNVFDLALEAYES